MTREQADAVNGHNPKMTFQLRMARVFDGLVSAAEEARRVNDFSDANVSYQAASNVAITARSMEAEIGKARRRMTRQQYSDPFGGEDEEEYE